MKTLTVMLLGYWLAAPLMLRAEARTVRVFVALCDNQTQGIVPVPAKIGDGDRPDENLYWGCSDGLRSVFTRDKAWRLERRERSVSAAVLERLTFARADGQLTLVASAYRGSALRQCLVDFEQCVASGGADLTVYIGHNGLMDFSLPPPEPLPVRVGGAMVLCCKSNAYFSGRLRAMGVKPLLMTEQLMYPGAFILRDALEVWRTGGSLTLMRAAAAKAYADNQKISTKAALGIFSKLE